MTFQIFSHHLTRKAIKFMMEEKNIMDSKDLKEFKEEFHRTKEIIKESIFELESLLGRIEDNEAQKSFNKGLNELKLAHAALFEKN